MAAFAALLLSAAFGAADQYFGSLDRVVPWASDVSLLSAPWLVLPFLAGRTQRTPRRGALLGLACTAAALVAYGLMTLSPVEGARLTVTTVRGFVWSESPVLVGALATGPLFGWLGYRWASRRDRVAGLVTAALLCLEPLARIEAHQAIRFGPVWRAEVAAGCLMAGYVLVAVRRPARSG